MGFELFDLSGKFFETLSISFNQSRCDLFKVSKVLDKPNICFEPFRFKCF